MLRLKNARKIFYLAFGVTITQHYVQKKKSIRPPAVRGQECSCSEEEGVEYSRIEIRVENRIE